MSKPGAKKLDQIVSATPGDVHIIMIPSPGGPVPTPIPHPCASIIKDDVATKVKVMGQPGAVKGSQSSHTPPHVPMGPGPFQKPPKNKGKIITGSANVFYEGKEAAMLGDTAEMCSDPSDTPVGKVMGTAATVLVGGGGSGSDEAREQASAAAMKAAAAACHKWIDENIGPGRAREQAHREVCTRTGHPIDVVTGKMFTRNIDLQMPGRIPLDFVRNYSSARLDRGGFGHSWRHSYQRELIVHCDFVAHRDANGRCLVFPPLAVGESAVNPLSRLTMERGPDGYRLRDLRGGEEFFAASGPTPRGASIVPLQHVSDMFGNRISLFYAGGRLVRITDTVGRVLALAYNERGLIGSLSLATGLGALEQLIRIYRYSHDDDLVEWQDELGHSYRYEYAGHLLVKETNRCGFSFYFTYDQDGWCRETWGDQGIFYRRMEYDRQKRRTRVINSDGLVMSYAWNELGVVEKETDHLENTTRFEYNNSLQIVRIEDPVGNVWSSEYDEEGRVIATENPEGASTVTAWDPDGRWMSYTDVMGQEWRREFDPSGREMRCINPSGGVRVVSRNEKGDVVCIRHENGRETTCGYNEHGDVETISLPTGLRVLRTYSPRGELISEADQIGPRVLIEYDARRDPTRVWDRNKGETRFEHDPEGRVFGIVDPKGRSTEYQYSFDKVVRIKDPAVTLTDGRVRHPERTYEYDRENRIIASVSPGGETTRFIYDGRARPMRIEYPDGRRQRYVRDGRDFVLELYENDELVFKQALDSAGRVVRRVTGDGEELLYEYDAAGNALSGEVDGAAGVFLEYDDLGRLVAESGANGQKAIEYIQDSEHVVHRWNDDLELNCVWTRSDSGISWQVARDGRADLHLDYDVRERLTTASFGSGERHEMSYATMDRPIARMLSSASEASTERFEYDAEGWLTCREVDDSAVQRYARDGSNRLVGFSDNGLAPPREYSWGFDARGNRVRSTAPNGTPVSHQYLAGNRIIAVGEERLTYDARGRVTAITGRPSGDVRLSWDSLGRLKQVSLSDGETVSMRYDAFGRRIEKTGPRGTFQFGWAGNRLIHEARPDGEERHYLYHDTTHRPLACYIRRPLEDWRLHAFVTDSRGAPTRLSNDRQEVVWEETLDPWGEPLAVIDGFDQPVALAGQYRDAETGFNYNFARYYLPRAASYLSPDPIGADGGPNAYAYVADPVCWSDPLGLSGDDDCGGKTETYYRTMSKADFEALQKTGRMPGTSETFISPTQSFSEDYEGVTVEFQMKPGTTARLEDIGVRDQSAIARETHGGMPPVQSGWKKNNAYFKGEGDQVNIGLGTGDALNTFNDNIGSFKPVSQQ